MDLLDLIRASQPPAKYKPVRKKPPARTKKEIEAYTQAVREELEKGNTLARNIANTLGISTDMVYYAFIRINYKLIKPFDRSHQKKTLIVTYPDGTHKTFGSILECATGLDIDKSSVSRLLHGKIKSKVGIRIYHEEDYTNIIDSKQSPKRF